MNISRRRALLGGAAISTAAVCGQARSEASQSAQRAGSFIDATEIAARIRRGETTAGAEIDAAIARARRVEPQLNAIVTDTFEAARAQAARGKPAGPFGGVPIFVKDLSNVAGVPTGFGSRAYKGYVPSEQTPFVNGIFEAGFICLGKSSAPEFGTTATTEPLAGGPTRNPWNLDHSTGGSSGGAGALVAAGVLPLSHASDGGGSIRIPASHCGLVGLKTGRNRLKPFYNTPENPQRVQMSAHGCVSHTVRDTAGFIAALDDSEGGRQSIGLVEGPSKTRKKIRVFTESPTGVAVHPDVVSVIRQTADVCANLGHDVEETPRPFGAEWTDDYSLYASFNLLKRLSGMEKMLGRPVTYDDMEPYNLYLAKQAERYGPGPDEAIRRLNEYPAIYERVFESTDLLLSPTMVAPPPPIGYLATDLEPRLVTERLNEYLSFTPIANLTGAPAISLPMGLSKDGLPIGAMFWGASGGERGLLELAYELEDAQPWINRRARLFVG